MCVQKTPSIENLLNYCLNSVINRRVSVAGNVKENAKTKGKEKYKGDHYQHKGPIIMNRIRK